MRIARHVRAILREDFWPIGALAREKLFVVREVLSFYTASGSCAPTFSPAPLLSDVVMNLMIGPIGMFIAGLQDSLLDRLVTFALFLLGTVRLGVPECAARPDLRSYRGCRLQLDDPASSFITLDGEADLLVGRVVVAVFAVILDQPAEPRERPRLDCELSPQHLGELAAYDQRGRVKPHRCDPHSAHAALTQISDELSASLFVSAQRGVVAFAVGEVSGEPLAMLCHGRTPSRAIPSKVGTHARAVKVAARSVRQLGMMAKFYTRFLLRARPILEKERSGTR
jgi:hypothetical protein